MDVSIGERRAIVKNKKRGVFPCLLNLLVQITLLPASKNLRFPAGKVGLHRERGLRQIQCFFVIHRNPETSLDFAQCKRMGSVENAGIAKNAGSGKDE